MSPRARRSWSLGILALWVLSFVAEYHFPYTFGRPYTDDQKFGDLALSTLQFGLFCVAVWLGTRGSARAALLTLLMPVFVLSQLFMWELSSRHLVKRIPIDAERELLLVVFGMGATTEDSLEVHTSQRRFGLWRETKWHQSYERTSRGDMTLQPSGTIVVTYTDYDGAPFREELFLPDLR